MNNTSINNQTVTNSKLPEGVKKRLLLSNSNYNIALVNNSSPITYAASYIGYLNFGPLETQENDPSNQIFVHNQTVSLRHLEIAPFINDCLKAYKMLITKEYKPFSNIITSNANQRLISSFDSYKSGYFYQLRIQFKKKPEEQENQFSLDNYVGNENDSDWLWTQKGIVFSYEKLNQLLSHFDFLLLSTLPSNDSGQRYLSEIYEAAQESQNGIILDDFFKNLDLNEVNTMSFIARRKKLRELLTNYGKFYLAVKKKPLQDFQKNKILNNLMHKFTLVCSLLAVLKYFFFKYVLPINNNFLTNDSANIGQQSIQVNPDALR